MDCSLIHLMFVYMATSIRHQLKERSIKRSFESSSVNTTHNMQQTAVLTGKLVVGLRYFSDGLAATSLPLSYEAEKAVKHLSCSTE